MSDHRHYPAPYFLTLHSQTLSIELILIYRLCFSFQGHVDGRCSHQMKLKDIPWQRSELWQESLKKILKSYRHNFYSIENHGYWDCTRNALNDWSIMGRGEMVGKRRKKRGMWGRKDGRGVEVKGRNCRHGKGKGGMKEEEGMECRRAREAQNPQKG